MLVIGSEPFDCNADSPLEQISMTYKKSGIGKDPTQSAANDYEGVLDLADADDDEAFLLCADAGDDGEPGLRRSSGHRPATTRVARVNCRNQ